MKAKMMVVLLMPFAVSGCMMAGMAATGGGGHMIGGGALHGGTAGSTRQSTVIKEVMSGSLRVTGEFPFFTSGESLRYVATIQDRDGRARTENAIVFLEVSSAPGNVVATPVPTHAGHPSMIVNARSDVVERTRLTPVERAGGQFVFRPTIPTDGVYRLAIVVERVGDTVLDPPVVVDHITQIARAPNPAGWGGGVTPLVLLGAAFMTVMMLVAIR
ncbi:MAG: hypothetical protein C0497_04930 [Gemmatimonas sp.]|nr:hypothetical protein [Gemmatimonas sp.]